MLSGRFFVYFFVCWLEQIINMDNKENITMDKLNESFQIIDELLRKAYALINPLSMHSDLEWYLDRDMRKAQMEKFPKCFIFMKNRIGREIPFPICNVIGMTDPKMILFSLKFAEKLVNSSNVEPDRLARCMDSLKRLYARYNKDVPTPAPEAARKAGTTKNFNTVSNYLKDIR